MRVCDQERVLRGRRGRYHVRRHTSEEAEAKEEAVVCSLTRLRVDSRHPLAGEIQLYQEERMRKLAQQGGLRAPFSFTVEPRKRRGH